MRINFDSLFKDIKHIVDAPARQDVKESSEYPFEEVLSSISPQTQAKLSQIKTIPLESGVSNFPEQSDPNAMARANMERLAPPPLEHPGLQPLMPEPVPPAEDLEGVKTPTIIEAKRIPTGNTFASLKHEERMETVRTMLEEAGLKQGVDPALSMAVVAQESSFDSNAVSSDGFNSKGLFQLLDSTGLTLLERSNLDGKYNPFDPKMNVHLGVGYLRYLHEIFATSTQLPGDLNTIPAANSSSLEKLAVAAFNAGEGRVASAQARAQRDGLNPAKYDEIAAYLPESTREYVSKVHSKRRDFAKKFLG